MPAPRSRRRRRRVVVLAVAVLALVWCALAAWQLFGARRDAQAGIDRLQDARSELTATDLVRGGALEEVDAARTRFESAHDQASSWLLTPFRWLPVLGRQVRSIDALTDAAGHVTEVGGDAMRASRQELESGDTHPGGRVALVERFGGIAHRSTDALRSVDLGPDDALLAPLADARDDFAAELGEMRTAFADLAAGADGLAPLLRGPARYLVFAANNAEMRAGSGMFLSVGVLTFEDGAFALSEMTPTGDITLPPGAVAVTGDFAARWGWTDPNQEWRNLAMTPRFDASASLALRMWKWRTGDDLDGVLAIDPVALQAILTATGPVEVDGSTITAARVVPEVLIDQYVRVGDDDVAQAARRERLGSIAAAALRALDDGDWDAATLLEQLRDAAAGRHVLAWSRDRAQQRGWRSMGLSGELDRDSLLLAVLNRGGNKLDQFLGISARIEVDATRAATDVAVRARIANRTPPGLPRYVAGPFPGRDYAPGTYVGIFSLDVPNAARDIEIDDGAPLVAAGSDGPARVVATDLSLEPGAEREVVVRFALPPGPGTMAVEPTARLPGVEWSDATGTWADGRRHVVAWASSSGRRPGRGDSGGR